MATNAAGLDRRLALLTDEIAAARSDLAARRDFADNEVGDVLEAINDDLAEISRDDESAAHARCDDIEARLAEARSRLAAPEE